VEAATNKTKAAWQVIRSTSCAPLISTTTPTLEDFTGYYGGVIEELRQKIPLSASAETLLTNFHVVHPSEPFEWKQVEPSDIKVAIDKLKPSRSRDVYDMSNDLIKFIGDSILIPLTYCINSCFYEGIFPDRLKISKLVPIYKKGDRKEAASYRPISVVPVMAKIFEIVIKDQVSAYFEINNLISPVQYGFRPGMSTGDAVGSLVSSVLESYEEGCVSQAVLCDLSKAFDCVDRGILLKKLEYYGIIGSKIKLFESYLTNRQQKIFLNNSMSGTASVEYGVPQGSVLGPFLFVIMVNDLPDNVSAKTIMFADDVTFFKSDKCYDRLSNDMKELVLNEAGSWYSSNKFLLNRDKTQCITFSLNNMLLNSINEVNHVKLLGIHLDSRLSWETHIDTVCNKLSRTIFLLRRLNDVISSCYLKQCYYAFFHSILLYGILYWGNGVGISNVLLLQKKAVRILTGANNLDHCRPLFKKEKILTVINLYIFVCLCHVKSNLSNLTLSSHIHSHYTRSNHLIQTPYHRLSKSMSSFNVTSITLFNKLPYSAHLVNVNRFKKVICQWLLENPFYNIKEFTNTVINEQTLKF